MRFKIFLKQEEMVGSSLMQRLGRGWWSKHTCSFFHQGLKHLQGPRRAIHAAGSLGSLSKEILKLINNIKHKRNSYYFLNAFFCFS